MNTTTPAINFGLSTRLRVSPLILAIFAYAGLASFEATVEAQSINIKQPQIRITVPLITGITTLVTGEVSRAGIDTGGVTLSVSGAPAGATATIAPNTVTSNNTPYKITLNTTNIAQGLYTLSVNANGLDTNAVARTNFWLFQVHAGHIWNGSTNAAADGAGNWSDTTKWLGGGLIGADEVIFNDLGGQTNSLLIVPNTSTNLLINTIVNNDTSIASLRFAQTNVSTGFHTLQIAAGRTLRITGTNGFSVHRDYISDSGFGNLGSSLTLTVVGTNGSMVVSNKGADFAMLLDNSGNNVRSTLDLSRLDNLTATVKKFALGDVGAWPNYTNVYANGSAPWPPRSFLDNVQLAKTNVIVASFVDPNNYTNSDDRNYSLCYLNTLSQGSTTQPTLSLGISNAFLMDSVCFLHANQQGNVNFTSGFTNAYALFRSTNGGRMSVFTTGDGGTVNLARSNVRGVMDFGNQGATLDVLVDRFYMSRDRKLITEGQTANFQTFLTIGKGTIDANRMILGFQEQCCKTNATTFLGYCQGLLMVSNTATVKVNGSLTLGYSVESNSLAAPSGNYGRLFIGPGGTVMASNIDCGGIAKLSTNTISATNGASLIVSNSIGGPDAGLTVLNYLDGFLTLHLDLDKTTPYVYATNLFTSGSNVIRIASIKNLGSLSGSVPLIQFPAGNGSFQGLIMPPGLGGVLVTTNNVGIYLNILTNTPKDLIWRGYFSQDWNLTDKNWLDRATGLHTNFSIGDRLTFDDNGSTPTTVYLTGPLDLVPGNIALSNNVNHYVFANNGGDIHGSATMTEWGSAGVQIDGSTTLTVQLKAGTLTGGGSIGSAVVSAGTTMNFSGNIGAGLSVAGTATLSGNSSGTLSVLGTGIVTNTGNYSGAFNTVAGALLVNNSYWSNGGNPTVVSNATMINNGQFHALTLTIGGKLIDTGLGGGGIYMYGDTVGGTRGLTINGGGVFIPGGDGIGTTTVYPELGSPNNFPGRMLFSTGSTNIFKVNPSGPTTMLNSATMGFGTNQNTKLVNGGTIVITNVTATPFAAGQSFTMFQYYQGGVLGDAGLNTTNSYPIMSPAAPGPGLVWDLSNLIPNGVISIHATGTNPFLTGGSFSAAYGLVTTNAAITNGFFTNNYIISHITWPATNIGWSLQQQQNPLNIGLSTNWQQVFGSFWTNEMYFTNVISSNSACSFYRLVYP